MNEYTKGDRVQVTGTYTDPNDGDAKIDPSAVFVDVRRPSGRWTTYTYNPGDIVKEEQGIYSLEIDADEAGVWRYYWYSTGTGQAGEFDEFKVLDPTAD